MIFVNFSIKGRLEAGVEVGRGKSKALALIARHNLPQISGASGTGSFANASRAMVVSEVGCFVSVGAAHILYFASPPVLYLSAEGQPLWGAAEGVAGGSYLLLNVGEGLRKVRVYYSTGEHSSCLAYLEAHTTAVCAY